MRGSPPIEFETSDVIAHIFYAVGNTERVLVTTSEGELEGRLAYPDGEGVLILHETEGVKLPPGAPLCVEYVGPTDTYRFYTEVEHAAPGRVLAGLPYAVERTDRRLIERLSLRPESGFGIRLFELAPDLRISLADISVGGLRFEDPTEPGLRVGQMVAAELELPDEAPMPCVIEVRHLSLRRGQLQVGCRFADIAIRDRGRLARALVRWSSVSDVPEPRHVAPATTVGGEA